MTHMNSVQSYFWYMDGISKSWYTDVGTTVLRWNDSVVHYNDTGNMCKTPKYPLETIWHAYFYWICALWGGWQHPKLPDAVVTYVVPLRKDCIDRINASMWRIVLTNIYGIELGSACICTQVTRSTEKKESQSINSMCTSQTIGVPNHYQQFSMLQTT